MTPLEQIRILAHRLWEQAGRPAGKDQDYWAEAQRQLAAESAMTQTQVPPPQDPATLVAGHPRPAQHQP